MSHIDTLKAYQELIAAGTPEAQAIAQVNILDKSFELEKDLEIFFAWEIVAIIIAIITIIVIPWLIKRMGLE